jgi:bacterial/archaeal transporter family-2 protein
MNWLLIVIVFVAGAMLPLQALLNARLGQATGSGVLASTASFVVGTVALMAVMAVMRPVLPSLEQSARFPAWIWVGGLLGAAYVVIATIAVPRLGAAALISLVVLGQMTGSILLDHYGVLHTVQPINLTRLLGGALVAVGALLVVQPWKTA